jgi:hypothetical protein
MPKTALRAVGSAKQKITSEKLPNCRKNNKISAVNQSGVKISKNPGKNSHRIILQML